MTVPRFLHHSSTPDPLSVLALLEDEQKFKLGGVLTVVGRPGGLAARPIDSVLRFLYHRTVR
ncbi:hypothetical protein U9M48_008749 [Paspalum notatum var. saurae]|uniref:Uncharacterized protein n=1 Tax=Paspalum notatum var. saurae TaxID=547442 RepID=A0AAQ3SPW7_PASNO